MNTYCTLYIVRHGETVGNVERRMFGHTDSPLTSKGVKQAQLLGEKLKNVDFSAIYSADLLRTRRTAEIITAERKLAVQTTKALRERCYGPFEGKLADEAYDKAMALINNYEQLLKKAKHDSRYLQLENEEQTMGRYITFLREISIAYANKKILVVSSGGIMRVFLTHIGWGTAEELPSRCVQNMAVAQVDCDGVDFFVRNVEGVKRKKFNNG
ncbi:hypothetical protein COV86_03935 [Candidatus Roizmanbacteria bacterium CG11_big_fil_rev_8_21_14_0_20_35_14]|uniref:Histidine phosphatase family protein n=1 Tax=Candidatus Roizmanbacteria bacterium CG11_big_fil_rev_8_21_14_0_20_35_14 TaxID=1974855 RepID=A0A2H0KM01_9BACT|nr:MAG: hypothetical protein COV86_03935 [Candidatus Roizmanbacteria bacterium CG11_big_fil_rev_8_21_14_0_20_35_14]